MGGVCRLGVASLRRMSRWSGDARRVGSDGRRMLEVEGRWDWGWPLEAYVEWEAYVGSGGAMGGVCRSEGRWEVDARPMGGVCRLVVAKWEAYVGSGGAMGGVCRSGGAMDVEVEGRWEAYVEGEAYVEVGCRWEAYVEVEWRCEAYVEVEWRRRM